MRHYVLTRSAYDRTWKPTANRRRLELMRGVTAASLLSQTNRDWEWVVQLHPHDKYRREREAIVRGVGGRVIWMKAENGVPPELTRWANTGLHDKLALRAYTGWKDAIQAGDGELLTTRIDDDDGFAPEALALVRKFANPHLIRSKRAALMLPRGVRVYSGHYTPVIHSTNAWVTLYTKDGDDAIVYDFAHRKIGRHARIFRVSMKPAWIWVRHPDTLSGHHAALAPLTDEVRRQFKVDWSLLEKPVAGYVPKRGVNRF